MKTEHKDMNSIKQALLSVADSEEGHEFYEEALNKIKVEHLNATIKKFNVWNIRSHPLSDLVNYSHRGEISYKGLQYSEDYNFSKVEATIKGVFEPYTKEHRIKEILPSLDIDRTFNTEKKAYFSLYELNKTATPESITQTINALKKIPLNFRAYGHETARELNEVFKLLYGVDLALKCEYTNIGTANKWAYGYVMSQTTENPSVKIPSVKIGIFKDHIKLSFTDKQQEADFKQRLINQTIGRCSK